MSLRLATFFITLALIIGLGAGIAVAAMRIVYVLMRDGCAPIGQGMYIVLAKELPDVRLN